MKKWSSVFASHAHMLFMGLLGIFLFISFFWIILFSKTDGGVDIDTSATVGNIAPEFVGGITINDDGGVTAQYTESGELIVLNPGTTKNIRITGTVQDYNGVGTNQLPANSFLNGDIAAIGVSFYRSNVVDPQTRCFPGEEAGLNGFDCYFVGSFLEHVEGELVEAMEMEDCAYTIVDPVQAHFDCVLPIDYFAQATPLTGGNDAFDDEGQESWVVQVFVADRAVMNGEESPVMASPRYIGIEPLVAATLPSSITYGVINGGDVRKVSDVETPVNFSLSNGGNADITVSVSGEDLLCGFWDGSERTTAIGSIPVASQKWGLNPTDTWASELTSLTGIPVATGLSIAAQLNDTPNSDSLYFNLQMPSSGVGGECRGKTTFTILEDV